MERVGCSYHAWVTRAQENTLRNTSVQIQYEVELFFPNEEEGYYDSEWVYASSAEEAKETVIGWFNGDEVPIVVGVISHGTL